MMMTYLALSWIIVATFQWLYKPAFNQWLLSVWSLSNNRRHLPCKMTLWRYFTHPTNLKLCYDCSIIIRNDASFGWNQRVTGNVNNSFLLNICFIHPPVIIIPLDIYYSNGKNFDKRTTLWEVMSKGTGYFTDHHDRLWLFVFLKLVK